MIIWQGFGFIVPVVGIASTVVTQVLVNAVAQDRFYYQTHLWPQLAGIWFTALLIYGLARRLDSRPGNVVVEKDTGQEIVVKPRHSFFFIPMKYWAAVIAVYGVVYFFKH
ncbi:hypothetical protein [Oleiharenicola lentus]|uniref:hypothetical protein n=1 Tax=Oleiharenicola lentus TaxID=2508720 RepID=UPI003F671929